MSCNTAEYDICVDQGATLSLPVTITGIDLTGATAKMQIRDSVTSSSVVLELNTENGKIIIDNQTVNLYFSATDTASFTKQYVYDLFVITSDENKYKVLKGNVGIDLSVTRW